MGSITDPKKINYLFKKALGVPNTQIENEYYSENPRPSRLAIYTNQMFHQYIPTTAPVDLELVSENLDPAILYKQISLKYPYIAKYKVRLEPSFIGSSNSYSSVYLNNAISETLDPYGNYAYTLFATNGGDTGNLFNILKGNGQWVADPDSGIVTFYSLPDNRMPPLYSISSENPPVMIFYRYEGIIGPNTFQNVEYF
jgi:hypothetical protein